MIKARYQKMYTEKYKQDMDFVIIGDHYIGPFVDMDTAKKAVSSINNQFAQQPKRTRTEYEKVTESIFDLRDEFERGELYRLRKDDIDGYVKVTDLKVLVEEIKGCGIFRLVEKEIDWREEVSAWVQENQSVNIDFLTNSVMYYHGSVSNDTFLELCRVALRANGEIE